MFDSFEIHIGKEIAREELLKRLLELGYKRVEVVAEKGDFSCRGSVVDIFPAVFEEPIRIDIWDDKVRKIKSYDIVKAVNLFEHKMVVLLPVSIKLRQRSSFSEDEIKLLKNSFEDISSYIISEEIPLDNFVDLETGDYVVHIKYGIGKYLGIERLKDKGKLRDHIVIEYMDGDKLYVRSNHMHLVQKYIGFEGYRPKLCRLGTKQWEYIKAKSAKDVQEMAKQLLEFQAKRSVLNGFAFSPDTDWQKELEDSFPYDDTVDQHKAAEDVKKDMERSSPMDRLICGDVGYGKTEVALRAAFKAVMDNKQVAILVPTTILAEQHYNTFVRRLEKYPVAIRMLNRFKTTAEQNVIVKEMQEGKCDIVIGTHRLLSDDVGFRDLGLVVIDEEQRFGVRHKEKLKKLRLMVDVLTLTATPIPRTLYMSIMGAKDMSVINTAPADRLPIKTQVWEWNLKVMKSAIEKEIARKGQIYFVHNRIKDIGKIYDVIKKIAPYARIAIGHGQMKPRDLEKVMIDFIKHNIDILLSTTIIESGIDIPNANTIIINNANDFGLADLYQLRGRVGRFKRKAYAYFFVPKGIKTNPEARRRLRALEKFTKLGAGFQIAMEDLSMRGAGNVLGRQQHGNINAIGFDLYCRLLRYTINQLKIKNLK